MAQTIALLRGINVGKAKRVSSVQLREIFESVQCRDVRTLLNSGNVVFDIKPAKKLTAKIEDAIEKNCGFSSRVMLLSDAELREIIARNPFAKIATDPSRFMIGVVREASDVAKLDAIAKSSWRPEAIALGARWVYLWCPGGILDSKLTKAVNKELGDAVTARNWSTMLKLHAMLSSET